MPQLPSSGEAGGSDKRMARRHFHRRLPLCVPRQDLLPMLRQATQYDVSRRRP
jgi:hypothetical protein